MIHYQDRFKAAILLLRETLIDNHFDLLVKELKLPTRYFREPGFVYYRHSIENYLARLDKKYQQLIRLFCLQQAVAIDELSAQLLFKTAVDELIELGLFIEEQGAIRTDHYGIVPFLGDFFIATIGTVRSIGAYLGRQSYIFAPTLFTDNYESFLDLGSGCGVLAILAARRAKRAVGVDIMFEATEVARANAVLNSVDDRVEFFCGDMYQPVAGEQFDSIIANAPFVALPEKYREMVVISSGEDGLGFLRQLIEGMYQHRPKVARMIANGIGSETRPLLLNLLESDDFNQHDYQAKLLVYSKGLLDDDFISGVVKIVAGAYRDRGEPITDAEILADLKELYQRLAVNSYYGIILELEQGKGGSKIEQIDIANRFKLDMAPTFRGPMEITTDETYAAKLATTTLPLSPDQFQLLAMLQAGEPASNVDPGLQINLFNNLERVLGITGK